MKTIVESDFTYKGFRCVTTFNYMGFRCGYVGLTSSNPLYGKSLDAKLNISKEDMGEELVGKRGIFSLLEFGFSCFVSISMYFNVHGSITYADGGKDSHYPIDSDLWWIGFDCGHCGDMPDVECLKKYFSNDKHVKHNLEHGLVLCLDEDVIRTKEYVQEECKNLVDQIIEYCAKYEEYDCFEE